MVSNTYTVSFEQGCRVVRGFVPPDEMAALVQAWSAKGEDWVADAMLCDALGATLIVGPSAVALSWRRQLGLTTGRSSRA